jgi:hypothetical protein
MWGSAAVWNRDERLLSPGFSLLFFSVFLNFTLLRCNKLKIVSEDSSQLLKLKHDTTTMYDSAIHKALRWAHSQILIPQLEQRPRSRLVPLYQIVMIFPASSTRVWYFNFGASWYIKNVCDDSCVRQMTKWTKSSERQNFLVWLTTTPK